MYIVHSLGFNKQQRLDQCCVAKCWEDKTTTMFCLFVTWQQYTVLAYVIVFLCSLCYSGKTFFLKLKKLKIQGHIIFTIGTSGYTEEHLPFIKTK